MPHVLYRFYSDTGQLLYVGITMNPSQRFQSHKHTKDWWGDVVGITLQHYDNRDELAAAEKRAIEVERPMHNISRPKLAGSRPASIPDSTPWGEPEPAVPIAQVTPEVPADLFGQSPKFVLGDLFERKSRSWGQYGFLTPEEAQAAEDKWQAKLAARESCQLCDATGYRGMLVCDHVDRSACRRIGERKLQVIEGGA